MMGEHFLPFRRSDVVTMCAERCGEGERADFRKFSELLAALLHFRLQPRIEALKDAYHPFDKTADTEQIGGSLTPEQAQRAQQKVQDELEKLAEAANYTELPLSEVAKRLTDNSLLRLRMVIDTRNVDPVLIYTRGESQESRTVKTWFGLRSRTITYPKFARVLFYTRFKDRTAFKPDEMKKLPFKPGSIIVKLFQDVPAHEMEMIFPNVRLRMRPIDVLLVGVPALVSGIVVIVTKLIFVLSLIVALVLYWLHLRHDKVQIDQTQLVAIGVGLFAVGGYVWRQISNLQNRRISFLKSLSENLYHRTLDNDAGVFAHLLDEAEEAEGIETLLAYHFLRVAGRPLTKQELDERVEQFFQQQWHTSFDFDVEDGLRKLTELQLATVDQAQRYHAVSLPSALAQLDQLWDGAFDYREPPTLASVG
jgi:hypothetical protein